MRFATVETGGRQVVVLWTERGLIDLQAAAASQAAVDGPKIEATGARWSMIDLIAAGEPSMLFAREVLAHPERFESARLDRDAVQLLAPIPKTPHNVYCLGRNYAEHIQEDNASRDKQTALPEHPQFFTKPSTAIIGDGGNIRYDERVTRRLDYEVELAVVIGRGGRDIRAADAMDHVFGYTIVNDITARDLQRRHDQWFKGKALDTSCPMGPFIVTADEISDPHALRIALEVNGEPRQDASTGDMIFRIPETIESLSAGLTLEPGDVIATGTPSGVGYAMNPRRWLAGGDVIKCSIELIGTLTNSVVAV
ncbi:fumarylacetoacetate hydrolase family protein [soil metagenome]